MGQELRLFEHANMGDYGEIPVRDNPIFSRILQIRSPIEKGEFVILFDDVKCRHEGEGVMHLRCT